MKNIGILGGTFDPIHHGHTEPVKQVAQCLSLDKVLFIPASIPPHKATPNVTAQQRAEMVKLACANETHFSCDTRELTRNGKSFTVDTLTELKQDYPTQTLFFIVGLDSLLTFTTWHKYQEILSLCHLVVNTRPNYQLSSLNEATKDLLQKHKVTSLAELSKQSSGAIIIIPDIIEEFNQTLQNNIKLSQVDFDISSSEIRARIANKKDCQQLLDKNVLAFINKNQLYR